MDTETTDNEIFYAAKTIKIYILRDFGNKKTTASTLD